MREQLEKEIRKRFGFTFGAKRRKEMREEIILNALDRYDEEVGNGASPKAAYATALQSVGNLRELNDLQKQKHKPKFWKYILFGFYLLLADFLLMLAALSNSFSSYIFFLVLIGFAGIGYVLWRYLFHHTEKQASHYLYVLCILIVSLSIFIPLFLYLFVHIAYCTDPNAFF